MERHLINVEDSKRIFEDMEHIIESKMCYDNVFHVMSYNHEKFNSGEWQIAYGFVTAIDGIMARHAFIVDSEGRAIDPTLAKSEHDLSTREYVSFKLLKMDDYLDILMEHKREPALYNAFPEEEKEAFDWAFENHIFLCK